MSWLKAIGGFLVKLLSALLPGLLKEARKPKEVHPIGGDKETRDALDDSIRDTLDSDDH